MVETISTTLERLIMAEAKGLEPLTVLPAARFKRVSSTSRTASKEVGLRVYGPGGHSGFSPLTMASGFHTSSTASYVDLRDASIRTVATTSNWRSEKDLNPRWTFIQS